MNTIIKTDPLAINEAILSRRNFLKFALASVPVLTGGLGSLSYAQSENSMSESYADLIVINFSEDYDVINSLNEQGQLTLRIAYNLFAQPPGKELSDFSRWTKMTQAGAGDERLRVNGAGENLVWSAADFENFLLPSPHLKSVMEKDLENVVRLLAGEGWPFRVHATYNETIERFLAIFERMNRDIPLDRRQWLIDHAETIIPTNIERIKKLGGGIAVQHRMAYQG